MDWAFEKARGKVSRQIHRRKGDEKYCRSFCLKFIGCAGYKYYNNSICDLFYAGAKDTDVEKDYMKKIVRGRKTKKKLMSVY